MSAQESHSDPLVELGAHLGAIADLLRSAELQARIGSGIDRELRYALSSFRQRFPAALPGGQPPLL